MNGRAVSLTIVAFLLGALAAGGVSVRVIREVKTAEDATSLPTQNIAQVEAGSATDEADPILAPFPITIPFSLSESIPVADIGFGYTVELLQVLDQGQTTVVELLLSNADPIAERLRLSGSGAGWSGAASDADLGERGRLTWTDGALPSEIRVDATGVVWVSVDGDVSVLLDGES